jgi:tetratricopeptide (TPR) repeat protein
MLRPEIPQKAGYSTRPAPAAEMEERLAELSLRITESAYANLLIRDRLARAPEIRLYELLGMVALKDGETDVAREHWGRAVELGTTNAAIFRELGRLEANEVFAQFNLDYRMPAERAKRLRALLKKSIECAPAQSMGYEMLAWVEGSVAKPDITNVNLVQAHFQSLNDLPRTLLALVLVRHHLGDNKTALELLDQLDLMKPNQWVTHCAEVSRARIEDRPVNPAKLFSGVPGRPVGPIMLPPVIAPPR